MAKYTVKLMSRALRDLDQIYGYISNTLQEPNSAEAVASDLEAAIFSLEEMPYRYPERRKGDYAYKGYRQMVVRNYIVLYRINDAKKQVLIVTVRYSKSSF